MPHPPLRCAGDLFRAPYQDLDCELWDGTVWVHEPHGGNSGPVSALLIAQLVAHVLPRRLGWVGDAMTGFLLRRRPDRVLVPDVSFTSRARLAVWPRVGLTEAVPDLVAEVRSPGDTWAAVVARGGIWIAHGVRVVWLVDPGERTVTALRSAAEPDFAGPRGTISGAPALPDLQIRVADLFQDLS